MDVADQLAQTCDALERAYARARASLAVDIERCHEGFFEPEDMRDANGRYILLDALAALATAQAALAVTPRA